MVAMAASGDVMLEEGEEVRTRRRIHLYIGTQCEGTGALLVTTRRVVWLPEAQARGIGGFSLFYPSIVMHAVCRDTSDFSHECVYMQLDPEQNLGDFAAALTADGHTSKRARAQPSGDEPVEAPGAGANAEDDDDEDDNDDNTEDAWQEVRLVPALDSTGLPEEAAAQGSAALDSIYQALCACAALNPDPDDGEEGDVAAEGQLITSEEALASATSEQLSMLERYDNMLSASDGRFDDAEEADETAEAEE